MDYRNAEEPETTICFYGSLSNQFNRKALNRLLTNIYLRLKEHVQHLKLYVIGNSLPLDLYSRETPPDIVITGYVDDPREYLPREYLARTKCLVLPLETGSGFRGRVVEVLALGIPIVGTTNALQSTGMEHGQQGFIVDTDEGIINRVMDILRDSDKYNYLSKSARSFAEAHYSLESTFGRLSHEISLFNQE